MCQVGGKRERESKRRKCGGPKDKNLIGEEEIEMFLLLLYKGIPFDCGFRFSPLHSSAASPGLVLAGGLDGLLRAPPLPPRVLGGQSRRQVQAHEEEQG